MATTIAVLSQKGGTGKTTMVRSLADVFERLGIDVLAIDADPQGNLSDYFDTAHDASPTLGDVLQGQARAADAIHGSVIPANLALREAELALAGKIGREVTLRRALMDLKRQKDLILIDCPPTLGLLTVNALVCADHAILTTEAQYFSLQGMEQAMEVVELAKESLNPDLELLGVCLNIANMRTKHAQPHARGADRALRGQDVPHRDPPVDRLRRVGRARDPDPRLPPGPRLGLPLARRRDPAPAGPPRAAGAPRRAERRVGPGGRTGLIAGRVTDPLELRGELREALERVAAEATTYAEGLPGDPVLRPAPRSRSPPGTPRSRSGATAPPPALAELIELIPARDAAPAGPATSISSWGHHPRRPRRRLARLGARPGRLRAGPPPRSRPAPELVATRWLRDLFELPDEFTGVLVTGATMANFTCLLAARNWWAASSARSRRRRGGPGFPAPRILSSGYVHPSAVQASACSAWAARTCAGWRATASDGWTWTRSTAS